MSFGYFKIFIFSQNSAKRTVLATIKRLIPAKTQANLQFWLAIRTPAKLTFANITGS
jgi:hypothetical protein